MGRLSLRISTCKITCCIIYELEMPQLVSFMSQGTTLLPWTVILTGTPEGVGYTRKPPRLLVDGDTAVMHIEGIGELANNVVDLKLRQDTAATSTGSKL
jgi:hypothetical protein